MYDVTIFGIHLTLNPVAFTIPIGNGWDVYWYGIIIATGFLAALLYAFKNAPRFGIDKDRMMDVVLVTTPVAILSARLYYVLFDGEKLESIGDFFGFGNSSGFAGIAIYGAVIGAVVCGAVMCRVRKVKIFDMFDLASIGFLIGQCIGRWGNFVNQEAFGTLTGSSFWGMTSRRTVAVCGEGLVHPCFLYESLWCLIGVFLLHRFSKKRRFSGETALGYCVWYGFGRGFIELIRTDSLMLGALRVSSLLSFAICAAGVVLIVMLRRRTAASASGTEYISQFSDNLDPDAEITDADTAAEPGQADVAETDINEDTTISAEEDLPENGSNN